MWCSYRLGSLSSSVPDNGSQQWQLLHKPASNAVFYFSVPAVHFSDLPVTATIAIACKQRTTILVQS